MKRPLIGARRDLGSRYLFLMVASFAVTVMAVRLYLDAAGYPKVGSGGLHVAHMLWGGLLLVVAAILIQLFVGRRAHVLSALAAGIGVGLFIDEVGKFITESNDYFFAPAAPIIYGFVLLLLLLWAVVRRDRDPSPAEATHGAIEALVDMADGRLTAAERDQAIQRLEAAGVRPGSPGLPGELLTLLRSPQVEARLAPPGWIERGTALIWLRRLLPSRLEYFLIRLGLLMNALTALVGLLVVLIVMAGVDVLAVDPDPEGPLELPDDPFWLLLLGLMWIVVGLASAFALGLSLLGHKDRALAIARYTLLLTLVAGGLLDTYLSQAGALTDVLIQLALLAMVLDQQSRLAAARPPGELRSGHSRSP